MGLPIIKSFFTTILASFIGNLLLKIVLWVIIILVAHGSILHLKNIFDGNDSSYGTSLAQAVKYDYNFITNNSSSIIDGVTTTVEDFNEELGK